MSREDEIQRVAARFDGACLFGTPIPPAFARILAEEAVAAAHDEPSPADRREKDRREGNARVWDEAERRWPGIKAYNGISGSNGGQG